MKVLHMVRSAVVVCAAFCLAQTAFADITLTATNNSTVRPAGPRAGANGKAFFNIEGDANGTNASFGVVDFQVPAGTTVSDVSGLTLALTEANAAFTAPGTLNFYLSQDTTTSIEPATAPATPAVTYLTSNPPEGLGGQLSPNSLIGNGSFNTTGNVNSGTVDTYTLTTLSAAAKTYLINQINTGGIIRLIVTPTTSSTAATFAGYTFNTATSRPTLTITVPTTNTISGRIAFQSGLASVPLNQQLRVTLTPIGGGTATNLTVTPDAQGNYTISAAPGNYRLKVKTAHSLSEAANVNTTTGNVSGVNFTLRGGDITDDNAVDINDLLALIGAYNQVSPAAGYSAAADVNNDGKDDVSDLLIIIGNYNQLGNS